MREGPGTRKRKKIVSDWEAKQTTGERKERFVSSLEVSNVFQYNALPTIIQLQSLILYIQTSWFTYTVLLLSLNFNKTKCEIISMVHFFFLFSFKSEEGNLTLRSLCHEVGDNEHYGYWRWPVSSCIRHTYFQRSTTVQKIFRSIKTLANNWQNYISSFLKLYCGERRCQRTIHSRRCRHWKFTCLCCLCIYLLGLHVLGVTTTLFTVLHEWRKSTVAQWHKQIQNKKKTKWNEKGGEDQPAFYPTWLHWM